MPAPGTASTSRASEGDRVELILGPRVRPGAALRPRACPALRRAGRATGDRYPRTVGEHARVRPARPSSGRSGPAGRRRRSTPPWAERDLASGHVRHRVARARRARHRTGARSRALAVLGWSLGAIVGMQVAQMHEGGCVISCSSATQDTRTPTPWRPFAPASIALMPGPVGGGGVCRRDPRRRAGRAVGPAVGAALSLRAAPGRGRLHRPDEQGGGARRSRRGRCHGRPCAVVRDRCAPKRCAQPSRRFASSRWTAITGASSPTSAAAEVIADFLSS